VTISGTITGSSANANILASSTGEEFHYKNGNIIAVVVDDENNAIYQASTDEYGKFSIENVPTGNDYLVLFLNSAGGFVGQLGKDGNKVKITPTSSSNLGDVNFSNSVASFSNSSVQVENTDVGYNKDLFSKITDNSFYISGLEGAVEDGEYSYSIRGLDEKTWTHSVSVRNNEYDESLGLITQRRRSYEWYGSPDEEPSDDFKNWYYTSIGKKYFKDEKKIDYSDFPQEFEGEEDIYEWESPDTVAFRNRTFKIGESIDGLKFIRVLTITVAGKIMKVVVLEKGSEYRFHSISGSVGRAKKEGTDLNNFESIQFTRKSICSKNGNKWGEKPDWLTDDFVAGLLSLKNSKLPF